MGAMSRRKGATAERAVVAFLRNLGVMIVMRGSLLRLTLASLLRGLCADVAASRPARWWDDTEHGATIIVGGSVWRRDRVTPGWERVGGEGWSVWLDDDRFDLMAGGAPEQGPAHAIHRSSDHTESQGERGTL